MSSDQKFTTLTADGQVKTASGGSTNITSRVTYIQATGVTNIKLYDAATASGALVFESTFGSEGLDLIYLETELDLKILSMQM